MPKPKGAPKTGGRQKGVGNKDTAQVRDMVREALSQVGGVQYLAQQATANPAAFMTLVGKVIPTQIAPDPESKGYSFTWKVSAE